MMQQEINFRYLIGCDCDWRFLRKVPRKKGGGRGIKYWPLKFYVIRRKIALQFVIGWRSALIISFVAGAMETMKVLCLTVPCLHPTRTGRVLFVLVYALGVS